MNLSARKQTATAHKQVSGKLFGILLAASMMAAGLSFTAFAEPESSTKETLVFDVQDQSETALDYSAPEESGDTASQTATAQTTAAAETASETKNTKKASTTVSVDSTSAASKSAAKANTTAAVDLNFDANVLEVENELKIITDTAEKSGDTSLGEQVVSFAQQFIGNSYRYGGSSLTSGTDCSGFVMSIFQHFGISLPHSSQELNSVGTAVSSLAEAKLGDILVYPGHCGIYIGNGKLLSALNSRKGISICSATYSKITAIRRVV